MNVDKDNFHQVRKFINDNQLIKKSKFISFDLQFTGVKFENNQRDKYDMFLNDKYLKMANVASKFNIVQIGLTFFVERGQNLGQEMKLNDGIVEEEKQIIKQLEQSTKMSQQSQNLTKYIAYPYNFYIFPRQSSSSNPVISMQASCIQFNTKHQMDWNRWICKGITYARITQFNKHLQNMSLSNMNSDVTITNNSCNNNWMNSKNYQEYLSEMSEKLKNIVQEIIQASKGKEIGWTYIATVPKYGTSTIRRAIQIYANQYYINFMITKLTPSQIQSTTQLDTQLDQQFPKQQSIQLKIQIISQQIKKDQQQIKKQQILGFSLIFQEIWNSNKILVGHHCLYDLLFIYGSFVDQLPKDYKNFKKIIGGVQAIGGGLDNVPAIRGTRFYDTKYIASNIQKSNKKFKKGTSLQQLYKYMKQKLIQQNNNNINTKPIVSLATGFERYNLDNSILHQAGFDSYLTGWLFLHLPNIQDNQGKISISKSYYYMNLRILHDQLRNDMKIFVIAVVLNNAYVQYQQLRNMRQSISKSIRDQLHKQQLMNDVIVIDGFKQLFLSMKDISRTDQLIRFLINLKRKNTVLKKDNIMSLESWIKMRAEVYAQMAINTNPNINNKGK